jgi:hypothetical protein
MAIRRLSTTKFAVASVTFLLIKLSFVSGREMVVEPWDAWSYVNASYHLFSLFEHPPGTSYLIWLGRLFGVPYRVFQEVVLAIAAFLFLRPLVVTRLGLFVAIATLALVLFNPNLVQLMDHAYSETAYILFYLAGLGGVLGVIVAPRDQFPKYSLVLVLASFAFVATTRDDSSILLAEMATASALAVLFFRGAEKWRSRRAVLACACALAATILTAQAVAATSFVNRGFWGSSPAFSREWWTLYGTLLALPVTRTDPYQLVNRQTQDLAAELSPTFARLNSCFSAIQDNAHIQFGILGCANWRDKEIRRMTTEITEGAALRGIHLKSPVFGLVPRPISNWLPFLGPSVSRVLANVVSNPTTLMADLYQWKYAFVPDTEELFNRGLLRRISIASNLTNPELPSYKNIAWIYFIVSRIGLIAIICIPAYCIASRCLFEHVPKTHQCMMFAAALVSFDIAARIGYYSVVEWIGWSTCCRYFLTGQVLLSYICVVFLTGLVLFARQVCRHSA